MLSNSDDFFPLDVDPKRKPDKPEPVNDDWNEDDYDENCSNCGKIYAYHTPSQALFCAKLVISNALGENNVLS